MAYPLFSVVGIELEYMIVDAASLRVKPVADALLLELAGVFDDFENGRATWSNELVNHVIEFKTTRPEPALAGLAPLFQEQVALANSRLARHGARLLPAGMHPFMDPFTETMLWPHGHNEVYQAFNRIFDCRGHGWSNLQSMHINLPFSGDAEFGRLHAAIRCLLPILPALSASSPVMDGALTGLADNRLEVYRHNSRRIPSICGRVIPEPVFSRAEYERRILEPIYADLAPFDPEGILADEFANARGAIARFSRDAIEIRVLDIQETPSADMAVASLVTGAVKALALEKLAPLAEIEAVAIESLEPALLDCIRDAERAVIADPGYLALFGAGPGPVTAGELWRSLERFAEPVEPEVVRARRVILEQGSLASRMTRRLGASPGRGAIEALAREMCDCLAEGRLLEAPTAR